MNPVRCLVFFVLVTACDPVVAPGPAPMASAQPSVLPPPQTQPDALPPRRMGSYETSRYLGPIELPPIPGPNPFPINEFETKCASEGGIRARALAAAHTVLNTRTVKIDCDTTLTMERSYLCFVYYPPFLGMAPPWAGPGDPDDQLVVSCPRDEKKPCAPIARWWP